MNKITVYLFALLITASWWGCRLTDQNEGPDSDLISNPNSAYQETDPDKLPAFEWDGLEFNFGKIVQGDKVEHTFKFTNVGKVDLIISSVEASCGCTVPKTWPKEPIAPGEGGEIPVVFDSEGKQGNVSKTISVVANTNPSTNLLKLKGEIIVPDNLKETE